MGRCASPKVVSPKRTSYSDARDKLVHKDEDTAHLERSTSAAAGTQNAPERCRECVTGKPKHTSPTPSEQHVNCNGSPPKRIEVRDSMNVPVHAHRDFSSRQRACASRAITPDDSTAKIQLGSRASVEGDDIQCPPTARPSVSCAQPRTKALLPTPVKTSGKASSSNKLKSVVHVPTKKTLGSSQTMDGKHTIKDTKGKKETHLPTSSNTLSLPTSNCNKVLSSCIGSSAIKGSLHDQRCDKKKSKLQLRTPSAAKKCTENLVGSCVRGASPDSTTPPSPKRFCQERTGDSTSSNTIVSCVPKVVNTPSGETSKVLPESAAESSKCSDTADCVSTRCSREDVRGESLHCSPGLCSGSDSTSQNDLHDGAQAPRALHEINEETEAHIDTSCTAQQCATDIAGDFMVNPLASFLDPREGIAAVQRWLAGNPRSSRTSDYVPEYFTSLHRDGVYAAQEPQHNVHHNLTSAPEIPKQDIVPSQIPGMPETTAPDLLPTIPHCAISAPLSPTAKIDSDQETASYASTESDDDCVILKCENLTSKSQGYQQWNGMADAGPSTYPSKSGDHLTLAAVSTQTGFDISLEDVVFELDSYTKLCVLDACGDEVAKEQVHALYLKGKHSNAKSTYTKEIQKIASAAVEKKRAIWKCSTGVLRKLAKLRWVFPQEAGCAPIIRELYEL